MTEADETIEETEKRLVSVVVKRDGDRVSLTETVSFEGVDYATEYSSWHSENISVLCENLSIECDIPKPKYSSDPDQISKTVIVGNGTLVYGGATSYGELGKLYRNNRVSFRISRSKNDRNCYLSLDHTDNQRLNDAWTKLKDQIEILPENNYKFDVHFEQMYHELLLDITVPCEEFDCIISQINSRSDNTFLIKCQFDQNSGVFSGYNHFKIPAKWEDDIYKDFIDSSPKTNSFSFHFYQFIKCNKSRNFRIKDISHFPIIKEIKNSRNFYKKFRVFYQKITVYGTLFIGALIWIGVSIYISETVIDFFKMLFNKLFS